MTTARKQPAYRSFETTLRVPFHDLDPLNVVWHGNYLKYFDIARFGLFESAGIDLYGFLDKYRLIFPVSRSSAKHIRPLRHNDEFICKATVTEAKYKVAMNFEVRLTRDNTLCATGKGEQVAVKVPEMEIQFDVPAEITRALELP
jgi:acyl-CoA thioester hydrolase